MHDSIGLDRIPLLIGVTGHRDIASDDEAPLREAFGTVLQGLRDAYPALPLVLLSALAAGADMLAAEEALARDIAVFACLPMAPEAYESDFSDAERARFRATLARCKRVVVLTAGGERRVAYAAAGAFVARYSHILVAFWDGGTSRGEGGTADVVRMRLSGHVSSSADAADAMDPSEAAPLFHIVTPRAGESRSTESFGIEEIYPARFPGDEAAAADFTAALLHLNAYDDDLRARAQRGAEPSGSLDALLHRTDGVANGLQRTTNIFFDLLLIGGFVGAAAQILRNGPGKVAGIVVAVVLFILARRYDYENRYQDYRALAEALRVQQAWFDAGLLDERADTAYLRMQRSDLQWIRMALRCVYLLARENERVAGAEVRARAWVEAQRSFYDRKRTSLAARHERILAIRNVAIWIGFACFAAGLALAGLSLPPLAAQPALAPLAAWTASNAALVQTLQTVPISLAALLAAVLWQYTEKRGFASNARRYQRMFAVFDAARERLRACGEGTVEASGIIRTLGREALIEHADWLIARREHPMSLSALQEAVAKSAEAAARIRKRIGRHDTVRKP